MNANANYPSYLALPDASPPALQLRSPIMPAASPAPSYESALSKRAVANQNHRFSKQDRYNEMRRLEDEEKEKSAHQQKKKRTRTRQRKNDYRSHTAQLQATPPPTAHDMTRDPSNTALLRQQLENTTIHDPSAQSGAKKGKGGRKPGTHMEPVAKAHANFMRQSGTVCPSCRTRKVKVRPTYTSANPLLVLGANTRVDSATGRIPGASAETTPASRGTTRWPAGHRGPSNNCRCWILKPP